MPRKSKMVSIRLNPAAYFDASRAAKEANRTLSDWIRLLVVQTLERKSEAETKPQQEQAVA